MPETPASRRASFTSSSRWGLMTATTSFMTERPPSAPRYPAAAFFCRAPDLPASADEDHAAVLAHGFAKERVGLDAGLLGHQVVGLLEVDRVDVLQLDELDDVDGPGRLHGHGVEVLVLHDDVLALLVLVALHDVLVGNLFTTDRTGPLVLDPPVVLVVQLVELEGLLLGGRVEADRDRNESERDGPLPHRPRHRA